MDLNSVDIAAYSTKKASVDTQESAGVKLINKQRHQLEAVVGTLLSTIDEAPRAPEQSGHRVNVRA